MIAGPGIQRFSQSDRIHFVPLAPGNLLARVSRVVVCNGGSPGAHQALLEGTPVLGIPTNLDQLLNMQGIVTNHVGMSIRSDSLTMKRFSQCILALLQDSSYADAARRLQSVLSANSSVRLLESVLLECSRTK